MASVIDSIKNTVNSVASGITNAAKGVSNAMATVKKNVATNQSRPKSTYAIQPIQPRKYDIGNKNVTELTSLEKVALLRSKLSGSDLMNASTLLAKEFQDPSSRHYDPYLTNTSNQKEAMELFGVSSFNAGFFDENRYLLQYINQNDYTDYVSTAGQKNWTVDQKKAYAYWQLLQDEEGTVKAEQEYGDLLSQMQKNYNDYKQIYGKAPSYTQLMEKVDIDKYTTLKKMEDAYTSYKPLRLNRPVYYSKEALQGAYAALAQGETLAGDSNYFDHAVSYITDGGTFDSENQNTLDFSNWTNDDIYGEETRLRSTGSRKDYANFLKSVYAYRSAASGVTMASSYFPEGYYDTAFLKRYAYLDILADQLIQPDGSYRKPAADDGWQMNAAYEYAKIKENEKQTTEAEEQWQALNDQIGKLVSDYRQYGVSNVSADLVMSQINMNDYGLIKKMVEGDKLSLNRPVYASQDAINNLVNGYLSGHIDSPDDFDFDTDYAFKDYKTTEVGGADYSGYTPAEIAAKREKLQTSGTRAELVKFENDLYNSTPHMDGEEPVYMGGQFKDASYFSRNKDLELLWPQMMNADGDMQRPTDNDDPKYHAAYQLWVDTQREPDTKAAEDELAKLKLDLVSILNVYTTSGIEFTVDDLYNGLPMDATYPTLDQMVNGQNKLKLNRPVYVSQDAIKNIMYGIMLGVDVSSPDVNFALTGESYKQKVDELAKRGELTPPELVSGPLVDAAAVMAQQPSMPPVDVGSMGTWDKKGISAAPSKQPEQTAPVVPQQPSSPAVNSGMGIWDKKEAGSVITPAPIDKQPVAQSVDSGMGTWDKKGLDKTIQETKPTVAGPELKITPVEIGIMRLINDDLLPDPGEYSGMTNEEVTSLFNDYNIAINHVEAKMSRLPDNNPSRDALDAILTQLKSNQSVAKIEYKQRVKDMESNKIDPESVLSPDEEIDLDKLANMSYEEVTNAYENTKLLISMVDVGLSGLGGDEEIRNHLERRKSALTRQLEAIQPEYDQRVDKIQEQSNQSFKDNLERINAENRMFVETNFFKDNGRFMKNSDRLEASKIDFEDKLGRSLTGDELNEIAQKLTKTYGDDGSFALGKALSFTDMVPMTQPKSPTLGTSAISMSDESEFSYPANRLAQRYENSHGKPYPSMDALLADDPALFAQLVSIAADPRPQDFNDAVVAGQFPEVQSFISGMFNDFSSDALDSYFATTDEAEQKKIILEMLMSSTEYMNAKVRNGEGDMVEKADFIKRASEQFATEFPTHARSLAYDLLGKDAPDWQVALVAGGLSNVIAANTGIASASTTLPGAAYNIMGKAWSKVAQPYYEQMFGKDYTYEQALSVDPVLRSMNDLSTTYKSMNKAVDIDVSKWGYGAQITDFVASNTTRAMIYGQLGQVANIGGMSAGYYVDSYSEGLDKAREAGLPETQCGTYALAYATVVGTSNAYFGKRFDKLSEYALGKTGIDNIVAHLGGPAQFAEFFKSAVSNALSEGAQEVLEETATNALDKISFAPDMQWSGDGGVIDAPAMLNTFATSSIGSFFSFLIGASANDGTLDRESEEALQAQAYAMIDSIKNGDINMADIELAMEMAEENFNARAYSQKPLMIETNPDVTAGELARQKRVDGIVNFIEIANEQMERRIVEGHANAVAQEQVDNGALDDILAPDAKPMLDLKKAKEKAEMASGELDKLKEHRASNEQKTKDLIGTSVANGISTESGAVKQALTNLGQNSEKVEKDIEKQAKEVQAIGSEARDMVEQIKAQAAKRLEELKAAAREEAEQELDKMRQDRAKRAEEASQRVQEIIESAGKASSDEFNTTPDYALDETLSPEYGEHETVYDQNKVHHAEGTDRVPDYREDAPEDAARPRVQVPKKLFDRLNSWAKNTLGAKYDKSDFMRGRSGKSQSGGDPVYDLSRGKYLTSYASDTQTLVRYNEPWNSFYDDYNLIESVLDEKIQAAIRRKAPKEEIAALRGQRAMAKVGNVLPESAAEGNTSEGGISIADRPKGTYILFNLPQDKVAELLSGASSPTVSNTTDFVPDATDESGDAVDVEDFGGESGGKTYSAPKAGAYTDEQVIEQYAVGRYNEMGDFEAEHSVYNDNTRQPNPGEFVSNYRASREKLLVSESLLQKAFPTLFAQKPNWMKVPAKTPIEAVKEKPIFEEDYDSSLYESDLGSKGYALIDESDTHGLFMRKSHVVKGFNPGILTTEDAFAFIGKSFLNGSTPASKWHMMIYSVVDADGKRHRYTYNAVDRVTGKVHQPSYDFLLNNASRIDVVHFGKGKDGMRCIFTVERSSSAPVERDTTSIMSDAKANLYRARANFDAAAGGVSEFEGLGYEMELCKSHMVGLEEAVRTIIDRNPQYELDPTSADYQNVMSYSKKWQEWNNLYAAARSGYYNRRKRKDTSGQTILSRIKSDEANKIEQQIMNLQMFAEKNKDDQEVAEDVVIAQSEIDKLKQVLSDIRSKAAAQQGGGALLIELKGDAERLQGMIVRYRDMLNGMVKSDGSNATTLKANISRLTKMRDKTLKDIAILEQLGVTNDTPSPIAEELRKETEAEQAKAAAAKEKKESKLYDTVTKVSKPNKDVEKHPEYEIRDLDADIDKRYDALEAYAASVGGQMDAKQRKRYNQMLAKINELSDRRDALSSKAEKVRTQRIDEAYKADPGVIERTKAISEPVSSMNPKDFSKHQKNIDELKRQNAEFRASLEGLYDQALEGAYDRTLKEREKRRAARTKKPVETAAAPVSAESTEPLQQEAPAQETPVDGAQEAIEPSAIEPEEVDQTSDDSTPDVFAPDADYQQQVRRGIEERAAQYGLTPETLEGLYEESEQSYLEIEREGIKDDDATQAGLNRQTEQRPVPITQVDVEPEFAAEHNALPQFDDYGNPDTTYDDFLTAIGGKDEPKSFTDARGMDTVYDEKGADTLEDALEWVKDITTRITLHIDGLREAHKAALKAESGKAEDRAKYGLAASDGPRKSADIKLKIDNFVKLRDKYKGNARKISGLLAETPYLSNKSLSAMINRIGKYGHESWQTEEVEVGGKTVLSNEPRTKSIAREYAKLKEVQKALYDIQRNRAGKFTPLTADEMADLLNIDERVLQKNYQIYRALKDALKNMQPELDKYRDVARKITELAKVNELTEDQLTDLFVANHKVRELGSRRERLAKAADMYMNNSTKGKIDSLFADTRTGRFPEAVMNKFIAMMLHDANQLGEDQGTVRKKLGAAVRSVGLVNQLDSSAMRVVERYFPRFHQAINAAFFEPILKAQGDMKLRKTALFDRVKAFKISPQESEDIMKWFENMHDPIEEISAYTDDYMIEKYGKEELHRIRSEIMPAFREMYEALLSELNEVERRNGLEETPRRKNYLAHIRNFTTPLADLLGLEYHYLPIEIAGTTEDTTPRKPYNPHSQGREGKQTDYNLLGNFERYANSTLRDIYLSDSISRLRQLLGFKPEDDRIEDDEEFDPVRRKSGVFKGLHNLADFGAGEEITRNLVSFTNWLTNEVNGLAGKRVSKLDRWVRDDVGNPALLALVQVGQRLVSSAVVPFNMSVAGSNFISLGWLAGKAPRQFASAMLETASELMAIASEARKMGKPYFNTLTAFEREHPFLAERHGDSRIEMDWFDNFMQVGTVPFKFVDRIASNVIVKALYKQGRAKPRGWTHEQSMAYANDMAARMMATTARGVGAIAYNGAVEGSVLQFTREGVNQLYYAYHDLFKGSRDKDKMLLGLLISAIYFWLYNKATGSSTAPDMVGPVVNAVKYQDPGRLSGIADNLNPFARYFGSGSFSDIPFVSTATGLYRGIAKSDKQAWSQEAFINNFAPAIMNLVPAGAQMSRMLKGGYAMSRGYTTDSNGNVMYTIDNDEFNAHTIFDVIASQTYGLKSTIEGRQYNAEGGEALSPTQSDEFKTQVGNDIAPGEAYANVTGTREASQTKVASRASERRGDLAAALTAKEQQKEAQAGVTIPSGLPAWAYTENMRTVLAPVVSEWQRTGSTQLFPKETGDYLNYAGRTIDLLTDADRAEFDRLYQATYIAAVIGANGDNMEAAAGEAYNKALKTYFARKGMI